MEKGTQMDNQSKEMIECIDDQLKDLMEKENKREKQLEEMQDTIMMTRMRNKMIHEKRVITQYERHNTVTLQPNHHYRREYQLLRDLDDDNVKIKNQIVPISQPYTKRHTKREARDDVKKKKDNETNDNKMKVYQINIHTINPVKAIYIERTCIDRDISTILIQDHGKTKKEEMPLMTQYRLTAFMPATIKT
eukprot:765424_1